MLYVATNYGGGYVSKLFDPDLGYFYNFILDGDFIFVSRVRIILTSLYTIIHTQLFYYNVI